MIGRDVSKQELDSVIANTVAGLRTLVVEQGQHLAGFLESVPQEDLESRFGYTADEAFLALVLKDRLNTLLAVWEGTGTIPDVQAPSMAEIARKVTGIE